MSNKNEVDLDVNGIPKTDSKLIPILEVLKGREPVFHHRELVSTIQDVDNETTEDFWEISASGCIYSRSIVRDALEKRFQENEVDELVSENWYTEDFRLKQLGIDTYLLTYTLHGQGRITRRLSIWKGSIKEGWKIVFHQGTVVKD